MSSPFLATFSERVVLRLLEDRLIEIPRGDVDRAVLFVANWLGGLEPGASLLSSLERALLACPEVEEVFVDLDGLKRIVDGLNSSPRPPGLRN